jgi:uncharacterized cupredoxin-like copper-binding protein
MMVMKKITLLLVMVISFSFLLSACGPKYATDINIKMADFSYTPKELIIPAGKQITLTATNDGKIGHEFVIMRKGSAVTVPFDADDEPNVFWEVEVEAGKTKTVTFTAPDEPGDYEVVCGIPAHFEAGMSAKLTVVKPAN